MRTDLAAAAADTTRRSSMLFFFALLAAGPAACVGLPQVCAAGLCDIGTDGEAVVAAAQADVETWEEQETAALQVELLQASVARQRGQVLISKGNGAGAGADVESTASQAASEEKLGDSAATSEGTEGDLITLDHNGHVCMLCGKPKVERMDKNYTEFRTDCGQLSSPTGPNASVLALPAVEIVRKAAKEGRVTNGFCELNFAKSCADAVANQDYLYWPKSLIMNSTNSRENAAWDGRYCRQNGFLEKDIVMLQHDFEGMRSKAQELCKTKYAKYDMEQLTFMSMMSNARYDDAAAPTLKEAETLAAWNCAMGDLGCDLALCAYSFCSKGEGQAGVYDECDGWHPVKGMPIPAAPTAAA